MTNFFLKINSSLNRFLMFLGLRGKPKYWGTVYDSVTKQPIDPAMVKLIEVASGKVIGTCMTDLNGHYGILTIPGKFKLFVQRTNYHFPSQTVRGDKDGNYNNLYYGEFFTVTGETDVLNFNIPLDPVRSDWNQIAKTKITKLHPNLERALSVIAALLFWSFFVTIFWLFFRHPNKEFLTLLIIFDIIILMAWQLPSVRLWGQIIFKSPQNTENLLVELSHSQLPDIIIGKSLVLPDGKFYIRAPAGKYILKVVQKNNNGELELKKEKIRVSWEGVVSRVIFL